jgi:hypothetical protein
LGASEPRGVPYDCILLQASSALCHGGAKLPYLTAHDVPGSRDAHVVSSHLWKTASPGAAEARRANAGSVCRRRLWKSKIRLECANKWVQD